MSLRELVDEWMQFASADVNTARHLEETMYPKPLEIICYHCQQSAEKALKAFLVSNEITPPRTHNLNELLKMCEEFEPNFSEMAKYCEFLTRYGVAPKYPHGVHITESDAKIAIKYAQAIYEKIVSDISGTISD